MIKINKCKRNKEITQKENSVIQVSDKIKLVLSLMFIKKIIRKQQKTRKEN
jgi:hypothetical protein